MKTALNLGLISILAVSVGPARSQTPPGEAETSDVRIVSSFVPAGAPVPGECREEAHVFAKSLIRYPRPESWHWILLCDEVGWRRFLRLTGRDEQAEIYASTDFEGRTTYLRGDKLLYPYDLRANPDDIIAHELAHIQLQSENEARAVDLARRWQDRAKQGGR